MINLLKIENCKLKILKFALSFLILIFTFLIIPTKPAEAAVLSKAPNNLGLVGYWSFDEGVGTKAGDFSGRGNNGAITSATWVNGKVGKALSFNGSSSKVYLGTSDDLRITGPFSITAWVYVDVAPNLTNHEAEILGHINELGSNGNWTFHIGTYNGQNTNIVFSWHDGSWHDAISSSQIGTSAWKHVVVTYNGSTMTMYLDGNVVGTPACNITTSGSGFNNTIGYNIPGGYYFDGMIDEVRMYKRALSVTEVTKLYQLGLAKVNASQNSNLTNGLLGLWSLDGKDISGTTVYDQSGQGNNGTMAASTKTIGKIGQALSFTGASASQVVVTDTNNILDGASSATWAFWMNDPVCRDGDDVFAKGGEGAGSDGMWVFIEQNTNMQFRVYNEGHTQNLIYTTQNTCGRGWVHLVVTYDGSFLKMYFNGVSDYDPVAMSGALNSTNYKVTFPGSEWGADGYNGFLDDVRIYNRALSASEIKQLYGIGAQKINNSKNVTGSTLDSGVIGLWSFDGKDISGANAYDRSGLGKNGTLTGTTKTIGKIGQALKFNGSTDQILISDTFDPTVYTYSMWVKPDAIVDQYIFTRSDSGGPGTAWSHQVRMDSSGHFVHYLYDGGTKTVTGSSVARVNNWYFITIVATNSGYSRLYVNGVEEGSPATVTTMWAGGDRYFVGTGGGGNAYFKGSVDDIRMYNRVLSVAEIKQLYLMGK